MINCTIWFQTKPMKFIQVEDLKPVKREFFFFSMTNRVSFLQFPYKSN